MSAPTPRRGPVWWHLLAVVALGALYESLFLEHSNGELFDEGWPLSAAMQLQAGGQLYREAFFTFPPGHAWPAWIAWSLDPPGVVLARTLYGAFNVALVGAMYLLGCRLMPARFAFAGAIALAIAAPHSHLGHLLFGYRYLVFSVAALLALARALDQSSTRWLFISGLWTGLALVFRLSPAFAVACGVAAALWATGPTWEQRLRNSGVYALGVLCLGLPLLAWLALGAGLETGWRETVVRVMGLQGLQSLPVPSILLPDWSDRGAVHSWFVGLQYWGYTGLYAGYAAVLFVGALRGRTHALLLAVVVWGGVFLLRTLGRSDDHHLNSALPPAILLLSHAVSLVFGRLWRQRPAVSPAIRSRVEIAACIALLVAWGFVQGLDRHFSPLTRGLVPIRAAAGAAAAKPAVEALELERLVGVIQQSTDPDDRILDLSASPLLYALSGRRSVGEFDVIMPGTFLNASEEARFVARLEKDPPALVIWPGWPFDSDRDRGIQKTAPLLSRWALQHYAPRDPRSQSHRFVILVPRGTGDKPPLGSSQQADPVPH